MLKKLPCLQCKAYRVTQIIKLNIKSLTLYCGEDKLLTLKWLKCKFLISLMVSISIK